MGLNLKGLEGKSAVNDINVTPLLDLAYEPIFISASSRKREKAKARGWRIISAD